MDDFKYSLLGKPTHCSLMAAQIQSAFLVQIIQGLCSKGLLQVGKRGSSKMVLQIGSGRSWTPFLWGDKANNKKNCSDSYYLLSVFYLSVTVVSVHLILI